MIEHLYKYRDVTNLDDLGADYSIKSLLSCEAKFSTRNDFNDLFDSKIHLVKPTPKQVKLYKAKLTGSRKREVTKFLDKGKFTPYGQRIIDIMYEQFQKVIDTYYFYCLSSVPDSNLMWSYYANSHKGFVIEFKRSSIEADEVEYQDDIPDIQIDDLFEMYLETERVEEIGNHIWQCLRIKLNDWSHEKEYRFNASDEMDGNVVLQGKNFRIYKYPPHFVSSVIFGCRTAQKVKDFITKNYSYDVTFKQATERRNKIEIVPYE